MHNQYGLANTCGPLRVDYPQIGRKSMKKLTKEQVLAMSHDDLQRFQNNLCAETYKTEEVISTILNLVRQDVISLSDAMEIIEIKKKAIHKDIWGTNS